MKNCKSHGGAAKDPVAKKRGGALAMDGKASPSKKARGGGVGSDKSPFSSAGGGGASKHPFSSAHRG
mgnify:CR=1 FL=1